MLIKNKIALCILIFTFAGCSTIEVPNYIRADHPYTRKVTGDYDKILAVLKDVFAGEGFAIQSVVNPSEYERREGGEDQTKDVLYFTKIRRHTMFLYKSYEHWNIFVHPNADGAEVDIRYEVLTPGSIRPLVTRNDKAAHRILDKVENSL